MTHPQRIQNVEEFDATTFEPGVIYDDGDGLSKRARWTRTETGGWTRTHAGDPEGSSSVPESYAGTPRPYLPMSLVSEPPVADPAPAEVTPTPEQRAVVEWLQRTVADSWDSARPYITRERAQIILDALPSSWTAPAPGLPAEPGRYEDRWKQDEWLLNPDGAWSYEGVVVSEVQARAAGPFRRLVPERPPVTREQIRDAFLAAGGSSASDFTDRLHAALVNGTDQ